LRSNIEDENLVFSGGATPEAKKILQMYALLD